MIDPLAIAARRHAHVMPGMLLVGAERCGIPASVLAVDVLVERVEELGVAERYALRAIAQGLTRLADIGGFLGFDEPATATVVASLLQHELVDYRAADGAERRVVLLPDGLEAARGFAVTRPRSTTLQVTYDRLLRETADWPKRTLLRASAARADDSIILLPPATSKPVDVDDLTASDVMKTVDRQTQKITSVLGVLGAMENRSFYRSAILLIYKALDSDVIQLGVDADGVWSEVHANALDALTAVDRLGITATGPEHPERDDLVVPRERIDRDQVLELQALASRDVAKGGDPGDRQGDNPQPTGERDHAAHSLDRVAIRWLGVYEHPYWLNEAVTKSRKRLLIMSPWITRSVVTPAWVRQLESLSRNCQVTIAWGFGDNSTTDKSALDQLHAAARRSNQLAIVRVDDTHAKILVSDDYYIKTSFNWLSFRGDPSRKFRMEEGDLVRDRSLADLAYAKYLEDVRDLALEVVGTLPSARGQDMRPANHLQSVFKSSELVDVRPRTEKRPHLSSNHRGGERSASDAEMKLVALSRIEEGQVITGKVKSVVNFGAFVDLGGIDGLVHISEMPGERIAHPSDLVSKGEEVTVRVLEVDKTRQRISLTMKV